MEKVWSPMPLLQSTSALRFAAALLLAALASCDPAAPAPKTWPAGTVFALDGVAIGAAEIDAGADVFAQLEPDLAMPHLRRLAFTNIVLPLVAGRNLAGPERDRALVRASDLKGVLDAGGTPGGPLAGATVATREGTAGEIGFEAWSYAATAEVGRWSEPLESVGSFELVQLEERSAAGAARAVRYKVRVWTVPYVDAANPRGAIEGQFDRSKLEIVDPAWDEIVPEYWKHRLRGGNRP